MKLPSFENAIIEEDKLRNYLLSSSHPVGRFKAAFFAGFGYTQNDCKRLEEDIRKLISAQEAEEGLPSAYGQKYEVHGIMIGSKGKKFGLRTIWIVPRGETVPRFVTAYPEE